MNFKGLIIVAGLVLALTACSQNGVENVKLETSEDSLAYAIGINTFRGVTQQGWEIDPLAMAKGMTDAENGDAIFTDDDANGYINMYAMKAQAELLKEENKDFIAENEAFLNENSTKEGIITTESGLQYKVVVMGDGEKPLESDKVRVHYTGTLIDGTVFDSSVERGEPTEFPVNGVITGWIEGLQLMPVGSKFLFYIPQDLAYGVRSAAGGQIQPFATLVFEVELLDIITE